MVGTPGLLSASGNCKSLGQGVYRLETYFSWDVSLVFRQNLIAEILLKILAYYKYNLTKSGLNGIINRIIHDGFTIGAQSVKLFQPTVAASHACCEE